MKLHEVLLLPDDQSVEAFFLPVSWSGLRRAFVVLADPAMAGESWITVQPSTTAWRVGVGVGDWGVSAA